MQMTSWRSEWPHLGHLVIGLAGVGAITLAYFRWLHVTNATIVSDALRRNISLAETLGATVVRVKAEKPAEGLIAFAQREGITHVIFGQSARSRWELLWKGSTIDKFLSTVRDAAVQVVPLEDRES